MGKDGLSDNPMYDDLKQASPEELLEATIEELKKGTRLTKHERNEFINGLVLGFKIAQEDGWQQVAPAWLRNYRDAKKGR